MKFVCLERIATDNDECEGYIFSDFNLYMELEEEEREEKELRKYLTELLKKFKILKRGDKKEICISLTNTTKLKALQFSTKLKQKINKHKEEIIKPLPDTMIPARVVGLSRQNGEEKITVYDVDKKSRIHYITSVDLPADTITHIKEITEEFNGLS